MSAEYAWLGLAAADESGAKIDNTYRVFTMPAYASIVKRPDGISTSNNTIVTSNLLDQLVVGISFFGTGAKERSNQFLSVFTPLAGSTVTNSQDQSLTDAEKAALHTHPAVIAQGATQADARTAIGAGTSSLVIGTGAGDAKAGNYQPTAANISDSTTTGRALLTTVDAATARTSLGLVAVAYSLT
jgi:hypothetical protein